MEKEDYNSTLNLPKTEFPMRGNLPQKEPETLEYWHSIDLYNKILEKNQNKDSYVLHDGPPYANGNIHMGHALNKVLKDIIVKYKNMSGYRAPYVPGWDTHGLPTEIKALAKAKIGKSKEISISELRKMCHDFALGYVEGQKEQFKRLGVLGDWNNPYITLMPEYEAQQIRVFAKMAGKEDTIYRGLRPVYWCPSCETALAEAEIEYQNDKCDSIYVKFRVSDDCGKFSKFNLNLDDTYFLIWTTTAWTLPGNVAICVAPSFEYSIVKCEGQFYIIASGLVERTMSAGKKDSYEIVGTVLGEELEGMKAYHPFLDRESLVITGDHVTAESGTGCVHTAPGHGMEDFEVCKNYPNIPVVVPVNSKGVLTEEAGQFKGQHISKAGSLICNYLNEIGSLFAIKCIEHQYPHCWRCKSPVIFRATKQWFCSVESFKKEALNAVEGIKWNPAWGGDRITSMITERKDWCISRQRKWGVPIPIFFCKHCGEELIDKDAMMHIADIFEKEGSGCWYEHDADYFMTKKYVCDECGHSEWEKEQDIMDVWFDSGASHTAVCASRKELTFPADLYLEGADQYRGWFQSSLLTSVAAHGKAPYKTVVTHGWVVDENGRKQSKSLGNGVDPMNIVKRYGADVLRLWVSSADYHSDMKVSDNILKQLSEAYRKIRNTSRFILGNLYDFDPNKDMVPLDNIEELDRWALVKLNETLDKCYKGYESFEFYEIFHCVQNFCIVYMSNFYLDIIKDRLYVESPKSLTRRSAQTVMYLVVSALVKIIAPILSYTAEEIWKYIPKMECEDSDSIFLNDMPKKVDLKLPNDFIEKWDKIYKICDSTKKIIEIYRKDKTIGSSLEANVTLYFDSDDLYNFALQNKETLKNVLIVSSVDVIKGSGAEHTVDESMRFGVSIVHAQCGKCERCWNYSESVGKNVEHPTLCDRCCNVIK